MEPYIQTGKTRHSLEKKNLSQDHIVHQKSHMHWSGTEPRLKHSEADY